MRIHNASEAARLLAPLVEGDGETVAVAYVGPDRALIHVEPGAGEADMAALPIRRLIADALRLDASGLILAHNHPSGDPSPSAADIAATRCLAQAARAVGVRVHDHLIFARGECRSLRALGYL